MDKLKRFLFGVVVLAFLSGCGVSVTIRPDGSITAKGCDSFIKKETQISCIKKPIFSFNFINDLLKLFTGTVGGK